MNIEQMISDANELVDYVRKEFNREKIFIVGLSWGSVIGTELVRRYPKKFHAYIGVAQLVNVNEGDKMAYDWLIEELQQDDNKKALVQLQDIGPPPYDHKADLDTFGDLLINESEAYDKEMDGKNGVNYYELMGVSYIPQITR